MSKFYVKSVYTGETLIQSCDPMDIIVYLRYNSSPDYKYNIYLKDANLSGKNLTGLNLRYAYLENANLSYASLKGVDLSWAELSNANLKNAYLLKSNLIGAILINVKMDHTCLDYSNLTGSIIDGSTADNIINNNVNIRKTVFNDTKLYDYKFKYLIQECKNVSLRSNDPKRKVGVITFLDDLKTIDRSKNMIIMNKEHDVNKNMYSIHAEENLLDEMLSEDLTDRSNTLNIMINYFPCSACAMKLGRSNNFKKIYAPDWRKSLPNKWEDNWIAAEEILTHYGIEIEYIDI